MSDRKILKKLNRGRLPVSLDADIIEFGRFRLNRRNRELLAGGLKLDLGARAIDVLLALIDAGGTLVSKDWLLTRVWPDAAVDENNLHVQNVALRRALGADRELIGTVPATGIRLPGLSLDEVRRLYEGCRS